MKPILLSLFIILSLSGYGQVAWGVISYPDLFNRDCGTWVTESDSIYAWVTVDTIGHKNLKITLHDWVEQEWRIEQRPWTYVVFCPCGCPEPIIYNQYRVDKMTGIRQRRRHIETFKYIPKPKSEYQKTIDTLQNK